MKDRIWYWAMPLALLAAPALAAYKCVEDSGRIFYQAAPCPANTRGGDMRLNINQPFTGQAQRPAIPDPTTVPTGREDSPQDGEPERDAPPPQDSER